MTKRLSVAATSLLVITATCASSRQSPRPDPPEAEVEDCSSLVLDNAGQAIFATNYDWSGYSPGMIFINRRGVMKTGLNPSTTGAYAEWTAKYASISFSLIGYQHAWAGMNERGLAFSTMRLDDTVNQQSDHRPPLDWMWPQYILDTCETVADVIATGALVRNYTVDHHLLVDRFGDVAVIEFLNGRMVVHTGPDLCTAALTNTKYASSCTSWELRRETGYYSDFDNSVRRFCRAADRVESFPPVATENAIAYAFDTLWKIYHPDLHGYTQWSIVFDTENLRAYFKTSRTPEVRWIDLDSFNHHCAQPAMMLDMDVKYPGDVSWAFTPYDSDRNRAFREAYFVNGGFPYDVAEMLRQLEHIESYSCFQEPLRPSGRRQRSVKITGTSDAGWG
ncbi:MAG: linear amide C-N hydrolase [bacterium]|nr:linear amide C-N hydrolase [bacterium]